MKQVIKKRLSGRRKGRSTTLWFNRSVNAKSGNIAVVLHIYTENHVLQSLKYSKENTKYSSSSSEASEDESKIGVTYKSSKTAVSIE